MVGVTVAGTPSVAELEKVDTVETEGNTGSDDTSGDEWVVVGTFDGEASPDVCDEPDPPAELDAGG